MIKPVLLACVAAFGAMALSSAPAVAQASERVLVIYGNDRCPTTSNGEEVVVCARRPESERYRIPKDLRDTTPAPGNERWADRAKSIDTAGAAGTGSCSATGGGGWTGCWSKMMRDAKAEKQAKAEDGTVPEK